jgi:hypothetical protein
MPVSLRSHCGVATVTASFSGHFEWSGDTVTANAATEIMNMKRWERGWFLGDELFLARRIVKVLRDYQVVDVDAVVRELREGWIRLLRDNLMPDPGYLIGERLDDLTEWEGLVCEIEARGARPSLAAGPAHTCRWPASGFVHVGDPKFLRFGSGIGSTGPRPRRVMWERVVRIHFSYSRPTPDVVIESRGGMRTRLAERCDVNKWA